MHRSVAVDMVLNVLFGLLIPIAITLVLLSPILLPGGAPFYGDETYYHITFRSFYLDPSNWFFMWVFLLGPAAISLLTLFPYTIPGTLLTHNSLDYS